MVLESLYHNEIELDLENVSSLIASASVLSLVIFCFQRIGFPYFPSVFHVDDVRFLLLFIPRISLENSARFTKFYAYVFNLL